MGIFNGAGRLVFSAVSDKLKYRYNIYYVILGLSAITTIITYTTKSNIMVYITICVISACYGAGFSCLPTLLSDIYGMDNISKIHGLSLTAWAMAGLVGNQISSFINIRTGSYIPVLIVLFGLYTTAILINTALRANIRVKENN
jgi:OFA family oxalate/formate antiporter-like MFS transporter